MSGTSFTEQSANAEKTRIEAQSAAADAEAERRRREALDAPKIAAAKARADEIERNAQAAREQEEKERAEKLAADQAEHRRNLAGKKLDTQAAKAVKYFAIVCFLVALPLQIRAFWDPERPWNAALPIMLESAAWVTLRLVEAAIANRRVVWPYLAATALFASIAAGINVTDGALHPEIGIVFGLVGGLASLAGPGVWTIHKFGDRAKHARATRAERKTAEAEAKKAEAELAAKRVEAESKRQIEADRRAAHEAKLAADQAAADAALAAQDEQRRSRYPEAWEQYERILAAHPLGTISRDRAWDEARRAAAHPDVYSRYQILALNAPANAKASDLWAEAWRSVKGLPLGQTIETLATELAAREYVEQVVAEHLDTAGHLAVEELIADIFGRGGEGGGTPAKAAPKRPSGGPVEGAAGQASIGQNGSQAPRYKDSVEPLAAADLEAARKLHDAAPAAFSTPAVAKLLGRGSNYAKRVRDAVRDTVQSEQS
ncbi:hypothetical protein ABT034_33550 [Streptomyces sp. NPDC002773]|uniref:hypothetical protein n=1 Tax=Streptomyces sp. NPDC002773 TaxID=3154430 RepID=UPI0033281608